jgi:protoheme IX farnesyltransferase
MSSSLASQPLASRLSQFYQLTKPRVVSLIVFTAVIGMFLATPGMVPLQALVAGTLGIALTAGAAAAINCLVEQKIDAVMTRTSWRPLPRGQVTSLQTLVFAGIVGGMGLFVLYQWVNALTMWLTLATFVGYAVIYTVVLKPMTPQTIVIGGASGAMPPVLGWAAVTGEIAPEALLLFLIIFAWTPPHFWALALYRKQDYARAGVPMLPVTHGDKFTRLHVLLYTVILSAVTLMPFVSRMSGAIYLASVLLLNAVFLWYAIRIYVAYSDALAQRTFRYSIFYLTALFAALLVDHYFRVPL